MNQQEFAEALKTLPCPECGEEGFLEPHYMQLSVSHKGRELHAEGEGSRCTACNVKFMGDELTESIVNQIEHIDGSGGPQRYIAVNRHTGQLQGHAIH